LLTRILRQRSRPIILDIHTFLLDGDKETEQCSVSCPSHYKAN